MGVGGGVVDEVSNCGNLVIFDHSFPLSQSFASQIDSFSETK